MKNDTVYYRLCKIYILLYVFGARSRFGLRSFWEQHVAGSLEKSGEVSWKVRHSWLTVSISIWKWNGNSLLFPCDAWIQEFRIHVLPYDIMLGSKGEWHHPHSDCFTLKNTEEQKVKQQKVKQPLSVIFCYNVFLVSGLRGKILTSLCMF